MSFNDMLYLYFLSIVMHMMPGQLIYNNKLIKLLNWLKLLSWVHTVSLRTESLYADLLTIVDILYSLSN